MVFKVLRSFRSLLFLRAEDVPASPLLSSGALPYSTALHFLFSKAPAELKSPHDSAGWSRSRYSAWLEDHLAEGERLQLIQGSDSLNWFDFMVHFKSSYVPQMSSVHNN